MCCHVNVCRQNAMKPSETSLEMLLCHDTSQRVEEFCTQRLKFYNYSQYFRLITTNKLTMTAAVASYQDKLNKFLHQKGVVSCTF